MRLIVVDALDLRILAGVVNGATNTDIAEEVHLSASRVKSRLSQLCVLTGTTNRASLAAAAVRLGAVRQWDGGVWRPGSERAILERAAQVINQEET